MNSATLADAHATAQPEAPRRRGRPPIYRDASQKKEGARLRKQRQRERERDSGLQTAELRLSADVLTQLTKCALQTFTDPKDLAAQIVATALPAYQRAIEELAQRAGELWLNAGPYLHYGSMLNEPGARYRTNGRTLTHDEWRSISAELAAFREEMTGQGWPTWRIDRFMRRSAERLALQRRQGG